MEPERSKRNENMKIIFLLGTVFNEATDVVPDEIVHIDRLAFVIPAHLTESPNFSLKNLSFYI